MDASEPIITQEIVSAIRNGDQAAFDDLFRHVGGRVYVYVYNRMGDRLRRTVEAEDVLQEVYTTAFSSFDTYIASGAGSMSKWLIGIARNRIRQLYKHYFEQEKRNPEKEVPLAGSTTEFGIPPSDDPTPSLIVARNEDVQKVASALATLSDEDREAVLRHVYEGEAVETIAQDLGVARTTLLYRISRALKALGTELQ